MTTIPGTTSGRDAPRPTTTHVHDVRIGPVTLSCTCCPDWFVGLREPHSIEFVTRVVTEHETGEPA